MSADLRRRATGLGVLCGVTALIAGAVGLGARVDGVRALPGLRQGAPERYTQHAIGRLAPVTDDFTVRQIGREAVGPIDEPAPAPAPATSDPRATAPPPRSIQGTPALLAPGGWELTLRMVADEEQVRAGDEIRYRMIVTNVGDEDFRGRSFKLEWHTPQGTIGRNPLNQCNIIGVDVLRAICASQRILVSPGLGEARHETFNSAGLVSIAPGETFSHRWHVITLPSAQQRATLLNHAHLTVNNVSGRRVTISSPPVAVTVVGP